MSLATKRRKHFDGNSNSPTRIYQRSGMPVFSCFFAFKLYTGVKRIELDKFPYAEVNGLQVPLSALGALALRYKY